ncbi:MAG: hypothetical protein AAF513_14245 [Pseudomonadota bacterium]
MNRGSTKLIGLLSLVAMTVLPGSALARNNYCAIATYDFHWSGQIAGFIVNGSFSYNKNEVPANGIVREEQLYGLDVRFYDPQGNLLRKYRDNHRYPVDDMGQPYVNFAFDTLARRLLQDGTWSVDDDNRRFRNGFMMGEGNPDLRSMPGSQSGLAFWSRPADDKVPHLHVDDWNDDLGFPIGFSSHEDVAFLTKTTQDRIDTGKVGSAYFDPAAGVNQLASDPGAMGEGVRVVRAKKASWRAYRRCRAKSKGW